MPSVGRLLDTANSKKTKKNLLDLTNKHPSVVHICADPDVALVELPAIFAGKLDSAPASGLGTNARVPPEKRKAPQAVFFGGGFSDKEFEQVKEAVLATHPNVPVIKVQKRDVLAVGSFGPNPDAIAKIYRKKLGAALVAA